ncbi:hypothetical protein [Vulcaniibacterium tengchongense]|nr:hypothetical protein [Vulcaniibacterium tengchongense]
MSDHTALALLRLLAEEDGQPLHRVARKLGIGVARLQYVLGTLGDDPQHEGLDLVMQLRDGQRLRLWLTRKGRRLCGVA